MYLAKAGTDKQKARQQNTLTNRTLCATHAEAKEPLRKCVREAVDSYFEQLDGHDCNALYRLVMAEVETPLLQAVMDHADGNQTVAAQLLGISRGTLRKKLKEYDI